MLLLTDMLGSDVRSATGAVVGELVDLTVDVGEAHPPVRRLAIGRHRHITSYVGWTSVASFEHDGIELVAPVTPDVDGRDPQLDSHELLLRRDVLDTQVVDIAGKRLARVSEVVLTRDDAGVRVVAVEVGASGVWRRLGLHRLAGRTEEQAVDWADLHLTSDRGHSLQLDSEGSGLHRLEGVELAGLVAHLPTRKAAAVLDVVSPERAAHALSASHPRVGARLLRAVSTRRAASVVERMPVDDATAVLRGVHADELESLLAGVPTERAVKLRHLLAHPADTAGGLMNTDVRTASTTDSIHDIVTRFGADPPTLAGTAVIFVVDDDGHPVGTFEPADLLAGRETPRAVPALPASLPLQRVIDLFALHDFHALPVIDDDGRMLGAVAIDDVLEELLAERLPGRRRFARIRR